MCLRNSDKVGDDFGFVRVVRKAVGVNGRDARWAATSAAAPATGKMPVVPVAGGTPATPITGDENVGQHRSRSGYAGRKA